MSIVLFQFFFLGEQVALGGIGEGLLRGAEAHEREIGEKQPFAGFGGSGAYRFVFARILEDGMFGRQALLRIVESGCFRRGILERLDRADRIVLVHVRCGVAERFDPIAGEYGGVFLGAAFRGCDHRAAGPVERRDGTSAGARGIHDQLALRRNAIAPGRQLRGGNVRAGEIEFVLDAVKGAVADQDQHEIVVGLGLAGNLGQRFFDMRAGGIRARQRENVNVAA